MKKKTLWFSSFYCLLFPFHKRKSMFAVLHSDINSLKSGLLHFTDQPNCKNCRSAKVKDEIINFVLRNYLVDRYSSFSITLPLKHSGSPTKQYFVYESRDTLLKGQAQYNIPSCSNRFRPAAFDNANIINYFIKPVTLIRRSTVLSLSLQSVFPDKSIKLFSSEIYACSK
jgi:hypothetical protein